MQQRVRNRQETINNRCKFWGVLSQMFRHTEFLGHHGDVVRSILVLTQIAINQGEALFPCGYKDPPYDNDASQSGDGTDSSIDMDDL